MLFGNCNNYYCYKDSNLEEGISDFFNDQKINLNMPNATLRWLSNYELYT